MSSSNVRGYEPDARSILEASPIAVLVMDDTGVFHFGTRALVDVLGHDLDTLLAFNGFDLVHPADAVRASASFELARNTEGPFASQVVRVRHADGTWIRVWISTRGVSDVAGMPGMVLTVERENTNMSLLQVYRSVAEGASWDTVCAEVVESQTAGRPTFSSVHFAAEGGRFDAVIATGDDLTERLQAITDTHSDLVWEPGRGHGWFRQGKLPRPLQEVAEDLGSEAIKISPVVLADGTHRATIVLWQNDLASMGSPVIEMQESERASILSLFWDRQPSLVSSR